MFGRASLAFVVVSILAFFCTQSAEAAKGPKITNIVYFDIKHGDEDLGRSAYKLNRSMMEFPAEALELQLRWVFSVA